MLSMFSEYNIPWHKTSFAQIHAHYVLPSSDSTTTIRIGTNYSRSFSIRNITESTV
uniref:Uncharacterized protein n=1 Tax=Arundo donax TaxID=35708 RepID=A0A0A9CF29_ARUDO